MTKAEALQVMSEGKKVRHYNFSCDEWMTIRDGQIVLEDGVVCSQHEFWFWRWGPEWNNGYELINE